MGCGWLLGQEETDKNKLCVPMKWIAIDLKVNDFFHQQVIQDEITSH